MIAATVIGLAGSVIASSDQRDGDGDDRDFRNDGRRRARNVILFIGDGMGVSTVTATRIFSVGVGGQLVMDQFPYTALSRTYSADSITPDSAPTMTAMMTGVNTNQSVLGLDATTEPNDFNHDGDGKAPWTLLELAKARGMKVGVVSTARVTHATPAATYAHINQRDNENAIALQALPSDGTYNQRLGRGVDILMGGGRQFFVPTTSIDEEGGAGSRTDGRNLRAEFQTAGYKYVWNKSGFDALTPQSVDLLQALSPTGHTRTLGGIRFAQYAGPEMNATVEGVWWSDDQALPSEFVLTEAAGPVKFCIKQIRAGADEQMLRAPAVRFPEYRSIDIADWLERH